MGTRADFYVGCGDNAEWLGSIAWDGYPEGINPDLFKITNEQIWRDQVKLFLLSRKDGTLPEHGWPWPWEDSRATNYAYAFDDGKVWACYFGYLWFDPQGPGPDDDLIESAKQAVLSNMKSIQNVTFGSRSGVMIVRSSGPIPAEVIDAEEKGH